MKRSSLVLLRETTISRVVEVGRMSMAEMLAELPKVCDYQPRESDTPEDIRCVLLKFAVLESLPDAIFSDRRKR